MKRWMRLSGQKEITLHPALAEPRELKMEGLISKANLHVGTFLPSTF